METLEVGRSYCVNKIVRPGAAHENRYKNIKSPPSYRGDLIIDWSSSTLAQAVVRCLPLSRPYLKRF